MAWNVPPCSTKEDSLQPQRILRVYLWGGASTSLGWWRKIINSFQNSLKGTGLLEDMRCVTHEASTSDAWTSFEEAMGGSTMGCLGALLHATNKQNPISKDSEGTSLGGGDISKETKIEFKSIDRERNSRHNTWQSWTYNTYLRIMEVVRVNA